MSEFLIEMLHDPFGRWFLGIAVVVFAIVFAVVVFLGLRKRVSAPAAQLDQALAELGVIRHEVKNNHTTNLREEADERHGQNYRTLTRIEAKVDDLAKEVGVADWRLNQIDAELERTRDRRPE